MGEIARYLCSDCGFDSGPLWLGFGRKEASSGVTHRAFWCPHCCGVRTIPVEIGWSGSLFGDLLRRLLGKPPRVIEPDAETEGRVCPTCGEPELRPLGQQCPACGAESLESHPEGNWD